MNCLFCPTSTMTVESLADNDFYKDYCCPDCQTCYSVDMPSEELCFYEMKVSHGEFVYILSFYFMQEKREFALWSEPKNDLLLELEFQPNITPSNAKEKLLTLLTFL